MSLYWCFQYQSNNSGVFLAFSSFHMCKYTYWEAWLLSSSAYYLVAHTIYLVVQCNQTLITLSPFPCCPMSWWLSTALHFPEFSALRPISICPRPLCSHRPQVDTLILWAISLLLLWLLLWLLSFLLLSHALGLHSGERRGDGKEENRNKKENKKGLVDCICSLRKGSNSNFFHIIKYSRPLPASLIDKPALLSVKL